MRSPEKLSRNTSRVPYERGKRKPGMTHKTLSHDAGSKKKPKQWDFPAKDGIVTRRGIIILPSRGSFQGRKVDPSVTCPLRALKPEVAYEPAGLRTMKQFSRNPQVAQSRTCILEDSPLTQNIFSWFRLCSVSYLTTSWVLLKWEKSMQRWCITTTDATALTWVRWNSGTPSGSESLQPWHQ